MKTATVIFLIVAFSEHLSSWMNFLYERIYQSNECGWEIGNWFYYIFTTHLPPIYAVFPVRWTTVIWAEYINVSLTFAWNFADLFIIVISLAVAFKYETINYRLEKYQATEGKVSEALNFSFFFFLLMNVYFDQSLNEDFWEDIRLHYNEICELQELLDDKMGYIVCVASLNDLYFVTLQLLNLATYVRNVKYA